MKVVRKYPKILKSSGNVGGMIEMLGRLASFIYMFYNLYQYKTQLTNAIFGANSKVLEQMYEDKDKKIIKKIQSNEFKAKQDVTTLYNTETRLEVFSAIFL